ncbi:MAG: AMP-binding protein [Gammaproteobacteria bacterium]|nr:AMP-binding protein [Gammaproteobacteria bacterium]NIR84604.1 AMP-binding protein [Gammaproteobacteria bacterium]NIR90507.1 AMP-binding protein [Gammaproteobacteria bacterium]NIU05655.1 AMP-binding protein [Gammaproteobacteria bacterium]NIV52794.1 AMP-binding protein [Gammaproteobacteria bacterium]
MIADDYRDFGAIYREFRWNIPDYYNIGVDVCDRHAHLADRAALHWENVAGERRTLTFDQLKEFSNRFANALRHLGIERGDRVGIVLAQRPETAIAHIATYKLGAVALPLSVLFGSDALEYRLRDSGAKAAITDSERAPRLAALRECCEGLEHVIVCGDEEGDARFWELVERASPQLEPVRTRADDPALLIYTSGTTGPPKGALNAHRCLLGNLPGFELSQNFFPREGDLMWTPADWAWTGGLLDGLLPALHYGVPVLGYEGGKFDPERAYDLMARYRVRNAFIPPTAMKMLMQVDNPRAHHDLQLRSIMSAGEQVGVEIVRWARETLTVHVNEMWGQTEFNYLVGNCAEVLPIKPGSMGRPYPGHVVDAIDERGRAMPTGEPGELAARGGDPVMFLGYWGQDEATREKFVGEWFRTGDVGYRDEEGYLWFVGRKDDVISSAGYRIGPGEIEDCLLKHPAVAQAAAIGSPDEVRGQIVKAFVVLAAGYEPSEVLVRDIQERVKTRLAAYEYPREIEFIGELPLTTTGKVRRVELRQRELERKGK